MKKFLVLLTLLTLIINEQVFSCSCNFSGSFVNASIETDLVVLVNITERSTWKMKAKVLSIYMGKMEEKYIYITGDRDGNSCLESLHKYQKGDIYVLALDYMDRNNFSLSNCGEYSIKIENGLTEGIIDDSFIESSAKEYPKWNGKNMPEEDFYTLLNTIYVGINPPCRVAKKHTPSEKLNEQTEKGLKLIETSPNKISNWQIEEAIRSSNITLLQYYIDKIDLLNHENFSNFLSFAARNGRIDVLKLFAENKVNLNLKNDNGDAPIHVSTNYPEILKYLHEQGISLDTKNTRGETPIFQASYSGCIDAMNYLIENGASPNIVPKDYTDLLSAAIRNCKAQTREEVLSIIKKHQKRKSIFQSPE